MMAKVCGLTRPEDVRFCAEAGVDLLGFIFAERSPRRVEERACRQLVDSLGPLRPKVRCVGVFVDADADEVLRTTRACGLDMVQLHGAEPAGRFRGFPLPILRSVAVDGKASFDGLPEWEGVASFLLFDGPGGGTGRHFDWTLLDEAAGAGLLTGWRFFLAGGLRPEDVAGLRRFRDHGLVGLDFNSGVETSAGVKDHGRIRQAVAAVKGAP